MGLEFFECPDDTLSILPGHSARPVLGPPSDRLGRGSVAIPLSTRSRRRPSRVDQIAGRATRGGSMHGKEREGGGGHGCSNVLGGLQEFRWRTSNIFGRSYTFLQVSTIYIYVYIFKFEDFKYFG